MGSGVDDFDAISKEGAPILTVEVREEGECLVRCFAAYELPPPKRHSLTFSRANERMIARLAEDAHGRKTYIES